MPRPAVFSGNVFEDCTARILALIKKSDAAGTILYSGDVASARYKVYDRSAGAEVVPWTTLTAGSVFASGSGGLDADGNNFNAVLPASCFPNADRLYRVTIEFTTTVGAGSETGRVILDLTSIGDV